MLISTSVGKGFAASEEDIRNIRMAYNKIGYQAGDESFGYTDTILERAIRHFQKDNGLKEDGIMHPKGETERILIKKIAPKPSQKPMHKIPEFEEHNGEAHSLWPEIDIVWGGLGKAAKVAAGAKSILEGMVIEQGTKQAFKKIIERLRDQKNEEDED